MRTITIVVEGGVIQEISGVPSDVKIIVKDYDVEGSDLPLLKDDNGDEYVATEW